MIFCAFAIIYSARFVFSIVWTVCKRNHLLSQYSVLCCRDTLFFEDFNLKELIGRFHKFKERDAEANMVLFVTCKDEGKF